MSKHLWSVLFLAAIAPGCTMIEEGTGDGDGDGDGGGKTCTTARLFAGDPGWRSDIDRSMWNPAGQPARATPPLIAMNLAVHGNQLAISTQESIWLTDTSAASPTFKRIAGVDDLRPSQYQPAGACASVRTMAGSGLAYLPDGRLVAGDGWGNGVIELSDPSSSSCQAKPIAGTQIAIDSTDLMSDQIYEQGDVDGPGAQARFRRPQQPTADDAGNVYVWDQSNYKIKKIATDAARTVSVVADLTDTEPTMHAMTVLDGKLYAVGNDDGGDVVLEVDLAGGAARRVLEGRPWDVAPGSAGIPVGVTTDGRDLIVLLYQGYIYRVTTGGEMTLIAGAGRPRGSHFPDEIDLDQPVPADQLPLYVASQTQGGGYIGWNAGHLYVPADYPSGAGWAIWDVSCPM